MQIKAPTGGFRMPEPGTYRATFTEFEDLGMQPNPYGPDRQKLRLVFDLGDGISQFAWLSPSLHPNAKFYAVATALLGAIPPAVLEVEDLIGHECLVTVEHYRSNDGKTRAKISDFRILRSQPPSVPTVQKSEPNPKSLTLKKPAEVNMHGVDVDDSDIPF